MEIGVKDDQPGGRVVGARGREMDVVNRGRRIPYEGAERAPLFCAVEYVPPIEEPDQEYPFFLTTGRVVCHSHTAPRRDGRRHCMMRRPAGDRDLERGLSEIECRNERQRTWLLTRIRQAAPQTLTVPTLKDVLPKETKDSQDV